MKQPDFIRCREAARIVSQLQSWIENRDGLSTTPIAHLIWDVDSCEIRIGPTVVWCSEENEDSELTFAFCRDSYLANLMMLLPFIEQSKP